jgi:hypothetical protein
MIRLLHGGIALGFGAVDALVSSKVTQAPAGIPASVILEGVGVAAGLWGDKVGLDADVRDPLLLGALAMAGARLTRAAAAGKLMAGPKAWGGDPFYSTSTGGDFADPGMGGARSMPAPPAVRVLPGQVARGGGYQLYPASQEAPGVAG